MKTIIIAIERSKFNYLYKYNTCTVSSENIINSSIVRLLNFSESNLDMAASMVEAALPIFESEHEVILLEVDSYGIRYNLQFSFSSVVRIIPLSELAMELLQSKLNSDFQYASPIPVFLYEEVLALREDKLRSNSASKLLSCFNLSLPADTFAQSVRVATRRVILSQEVLEKPGTIDLLLDFNTTPSGIPSGNIEGLMKIICVGMLKVTGNVDRLRESPLFNLLLDNLERLNQGSLLSCYQSFQEISDANKEKIERLDATLASVEIDSDLFLFLFLFISFKKKIQNNHFDISQIVFDVDEIKPKYKVELSQALYLIGYTMSMGVLHESIHRLSASPLFIAKNEIEYINESKEITTDGVSSVIHSNDREMPGSQEIEISELSEIKSNLDEPERLYNEDENTAPVKKEPSDSPDLFGTMNERECLLKKAKGKLRAGAKKKELLQSVESLHKENPSFSFNELEAKLLSNASLLKKGGLPLKVTQDLLDIFKALS